MRLERIKQNQIRFSITIEELEEKGLLEEELWKESDIWHNLFEELMETAARQFGVEWEEIVTVEILSLTSVELILLFTIESLENYDFRKDEEGVCPDLMTEECALIVQLSSFEDVISLSHRLHQIDYGISTLYHYQDNFYLSFLLPPVPSVGLEALLKEYGEEGTTTLSILNEYGNKIIEHSACQMVRDYFSLH
ncbi:adaptor protein MecA [Bacillus spongiae]|uniref:Adaptor protein MecA n=1 Tax=Bacillus spongiae TaxID=2683610 RepID=A0ABU8HD16_9BACI